VKWPWSRRDLDPLSPEQQSRVDEVIAAHATGYRGDWGHLAEGLHRELGVSRERAFFYLMVNQLGGITSALEALQHPTYRDGCKHCERQREQDEQFRVNTEYQKWMMRHADPEKQKSYLEKYNRIMDAELKNLDGEADWKP